MGTARQTFDEFLKEHSSYESAYTSLQEGSRILAISAQLVYELHGSELGAVADEVLSFVENRYRPDFMKRYMARVNAMAALQRRFDANPSAASLGEPSAL